VEDLLATKSEGAGLIVRAITFQDCQPMWSLSSNVTDRQTDRRTDDMQSQDRALHYSSASRGKNDVTGKMFFHGSVPRVHTTFAASLPPQYGTHSLQAFALVLHHIYILSSS